MTKKDYQAIAQALYGVKEDYRGGTPDPDARHADTVWAIADVMQADNPRFDRARFVEACETGRCKGMRREP